MLQAVSEDSVSEKGRQLYYQLKPLLEKKYDPDRVVLINTESGEYFVGKNTLEAYRLAKERYKNRYKGEKFFSAHVGQLSSALK